MYARTGAGPPVRVMLPPKRLPKPTGASSYWGTPTRLMTPPGRTTPTACSYAGRCADRLEDDVAASVGQVTHGRDAFLAAGGDDVGCPERAPEVGACLVAAHEHDPLGPELGRREDGEQTDGAVTDDGDRAAVRDAAADGRVPARAVDVGQGEQGREERLVGFRGDAGDLHQGAVGEGDPHGLGLPAPGAQVGVVPEPAHQAGGLQPGAAELAHTAGHSEGRDDEVSRGERADLLDDADELVADRGAVPSRGAVIRMQVAAAHASAGHAHQGVAGLLDARVGGVGDAEVSRAVQVGGSHGDQSTPVRVGVGVTLVPGTASASPGWPAAPTVVA